MREWRNRQTRKFEGRVVNTVRVQVPFPAPKKQVGNCLPAFLRENRLAKPTAAPAAYGHFLPKARVRSERSERCSSPVPFYHTADRLLPVCFFCAKIGSRNVPPRQRHTGTPCQSSPTAPLFWGENTSILGFSLHFSSPP